MKRYLAVLLVLLLLPCLAQAEQVREIDWSKPVVAITFDDGPSQYTLSILETLEEYGCRATFFMLGNRMGSYKEVVEAVAASENEIGTHTWSHKKLSELGSAGVKLELNEGIKRIKELTGRETRFLRPPYGAVSNKVYSYCVQNKMVVVNWSLGSDDWRTTSAKDVADTILSRVQSGDIILCHDTLEHTAEAMKTVIPELVARGYQVLTLTEIFSGYEEELVSTGKYSRMYPERVKEQK